MIFDKGHNKITTLKEALRKISSKTLSEEELERGARHLIGFAKCLLEMRQEIMKAIILTRVSTKMQEEGLSLLAQSSRLQDYADRKGLEVIKTFEIVESSTRGERKQFMEMINFCKRQRETIAIVADTVDRVQRSFKESVLLDELMRQDKIELHFYREGMVLNSKSTSVDIMRWDFSVMGAKAYVLQLSENVRRSTEQKNKNGEITGLAPLGYENYIDERGKHFVRQKEPFASIIRQCYEMYSLGRASVGNYALCQYDGIKDTKRFLDTYQHDVPHLGKSVLLWRNENQTRTYDACISNIGQQRAVGYVPRAKGNQGRTVLKNK